MSQDTDFQALDALLASPPALADKGFTGRVARRARGLKRKRRNLFLLTGLCWCLMIFIAGSPQAIQGDLVMLVQSIEIGSLYPAVLDFYQRAHDHSEGLPYIPFAATLLSLLAVASMALRA